MNPTPGAVLQEFLGGDVPLGPLAYTKASSAAFCYRTLGLTLQISPPPPLTYPKVAVLQKLLRSLAQSCQNKTDWLLLLLLLLLLSLFWSGNSQFH